MRKCMLSHLNSACPEAYGRSSGNSKSNCDTCDTHREKTGQSTVLDEAHGDSGSARVQGWSF